MVAKKSFVNAQTRALLDAVGRLYEAGLDDEQWLAALESMCGLMDAPRAAIGLIDAERNHLSFARCFNYDPDFLKTYDAYYLSVHPFRRLFLSLPESVGTRRHFVPDEAYFRTEYYNDWAKPQELDDDAGYLFNRDPARIVLLTVTRPRRQAKFGPGELALLGTLAPHLKRALALRGRLWGLSRERGALAGALEGLAFGVVLIDEDGRPCHANAAARAVLAAGEGLVQRGRRLGASLPAEGETLRRLIHAAVQASLGEGGSGGGVVRLSRPSQAHPLLVQVYPLRGPAGDGMRAEAATARAVLVISDPGLVTAPPSEVLRLAFGLTPAESRLVGLLAQGIGLREAAESLEISRETARNQLKAVFGKTDTHRQAELVRLVTALGLAAGGPSQEAAASD